MEATKSRLMRPTLHTFSFQISVFLLHQFLKLHVRSFNFVIFTGVFEVKKVTRVYLFPRLLRFIPADCYRWLISSSKIKILINNLMGGTTSLEECTSHGPWGGSQGKEWVYMPEGFIKKIRIVYGKVIDCIIFKSDCPSDKTQSCIFGGNGGDKTDMIFIDFPNEYLTSISGTIGCYKGSDVVMSLCFHTNQNRYGPYGTCDKGSPFSYDGEGGVVVGFHGRFGQYMDAIGIYSMPESVALLQNSTTNSTEELCCRMSLMAMPRESGPWGALGAKPWDDGVFHDVKQIRVHVGESLKVIHAIQFEYVRRDGQFVLSQLHGGKGGEKIEVVDLADTEEYLTGISGFYGPVEGHSGLEAIMAITFHTNKGIYGPYGHENGAGYVYFTSTSSPGKVVGFQGRSNGFLSANWSSHGVFLKIMKNSKTYESMVVPYTL